MGQRDGMDAVVKGTKAHKCRFGSRSLVTILTELHLLPIQILS